MTKIASLAAGLALGASQVTAVTYAVPAQFGAPGYTYTALDPAPVGVS